MRNELTFFQNNPTGDLKLTAQKVENKLFLTTGNEFRGNQSLGAVLRYNLDRKKSIELELVRGLRYSNAVNFPSRNYQVSSRELNPRFNFQYSRKVRFNLGYTYKFKFNTDDSLRRNALINYHKISGKSTFNLKDRNNLNLSLDLVSIGQRGDAGFNANYELRESLRPGFNAIWQVFVTWYVFKDIELSITYDGRAAQAAQVIHTGRVQARAFF